MRKSKQAASKSTSDTSKGAGEDPCRAEDMKQAMADMIENCGCCEGMMERFNATRRARRTPGSPAKT